LTGWSTPSRCNQQETIRIQLSTVLQAVISQLLLPRCDKPGRVAVYEIMINTPAMQALIRDNKTFRINSDIQTGAKYGHGHPGRLPHGNTMKGLIAREEVVTKAQDPQPSSRNWPNGKPPRPKPPPGAQETSNEPQV
jgi:twitching motility protein PilT